VDHGARWPITMTSRPVARCALLCPRGFDQGFGPLRSSACRATGIRTSRGLAGWPALRGGCRARRFLGSVVVGGGPLGERPGRWRTVAGRCEEEEDGQSGERGDRRRDQDGTGQRGVAGEHGATVVASALRAKRKGPARWG
jgi:hypothetical protein